MHNRGRSWSWLAVSLMALAGDGCQFALGGVDAESMAADLSVPPDGATPTPDLTIDGLSDPCGAPGAVAGATAASCVIGDPPSVDGALDDWAPSLFVHPIQHATSEHIEGPWSGNEAANDKNCSGSFALKWDATNLYIAVRVTDDMRDISQPAYYNDDAVEIYIDARNDRTNVYESDDLQLILLPTGLSQAYRFGVAPYPAAIASPAGLLAVGRDDSTGDASYTLEAAIPWSALTLSSVAPGQLIGFDLQLDDNDATATRTRALSWKNAAQAGCFCPATGIACLPYCSPTSFVAVELGGR